MNSTLKQAQSPGVGGKPMQNAATYGQPSTHITQNPYPNINVAHAHSTMQQNHFPQHYPNIQPSNHPVANQGGGNNKNLATYYQPVTTASENVDKPHSNGTSEDNKAQESVQIEEKQENRVENSKITEEKQETSTTSVDVEAQQQSKKEEVEENVKETQDKEPEPTSVGNSNNSNVEAAAVATPQQKVVGDVAKDEAENLKESKIDEEVEEEELEEEEDEVVCKESEEDDCDDKNNKSSEDSNDGDKAEVPSKKPKQRPQQRKPPAQKSPSGGGGGGAPKAKRQRTKTQHYQSPLPEMEIITKITSTAPKSRNNDERLIYFYRNEFLAVRNAEGGFYLCQTLQNVYRSSSKIKIRWLSQDKGDKSGEIYTPDFYDQTDFDCILTSLDLVRVDKGMYRLTEEERERTDSILKRCLAVEKGEIVSPSLSEEHPDGLDISLYKDEEQLKKKQTTKRQGRKRKARSTSTKKSQQQQPTPTKKSPETPKTRKVEESQTTNAKTRRTPAKSKKPSAAVTAVKKAAQEVNKRAAAAANSPVGGVKRGKGKKSPIVDEKKAKVLAKIGRKASAVAATAKVQSKGGRSPKAATKAAPTRKTKRSHKN